MSTQAQMKDLDQLTPLVYKLREELPFDFIEEHDTWYSGLVNRLLGDPEFKGSAMIVNGITKINGVVPFFYADEILGRNIDPFVEEQTEVIDEFNPVAAYNKAHAAIEDTIGISIFNDKTNDLNYVEGFWGNRKPLYQQISKAKYDRIVHGRGHRAIVETNAYFRVTHGVNRLYGTAISCYVLFNRAYWYNKAKDKYHSLQLNGYTKDDFSALSISPAYNASRRGGCKDWDMIELEWLIEDCQVPYFMLELYELNHVITPDKVFAKKLSPDYKQPTLMRLLLRKLFDTTNGKLSQTNPNLLRDETT